MDSPDVFSSIQRLHPWVGWAEGMVLSLEEGRCVHSIPSVSCLMWKCLVFLSFLVSRLPVALGSGPEQGSPAPPAPGQGQPSGEKARVEKSLRGGRPSGEQGLLVHPKLILPSICSLQGAPSRKPSVPGVVPGPGGGGAQADHAQPAGPARLAVRLLGPAPSHSQLLVVSAEPEPFPAWLLWAMEWGEGAIPL